MTEIDWTMTRWRLADPGGMTVKQRPGRGTATFSYIDAREVMDRLDAVVGPGNWSTTFRGPFDGLAVECTLTVHGVAKTDVGYPNSAKDGHDQEGLKAAYSDALKRAAVHWGIGRFLYDDRAVLEPCATCGEIVGGGWHFNKDNESVPYSPAAAVHASKKKYGAALCERHRPDPEKEKA